MKEALFELEFYIKAHKITHFEDELVVHISNYPESSKRKREIQIRNRIKQSVLEIIKEIEEGNE